jgi:hypothetical protein
LRQKQWSSSIAPYKLSIRKPGIDKDFENYKTEHINIAPGDLVLN